MRVALAFDAVPIQSSIPKTRRIHPTHLYLMNVLIPHSCCRTYATTESLAPIVEGSPVIGPVEENASTNTPAAGKSCAGYVGSVPFVLKPATAAWIF